MGILALTSAAGSSTAAAASALSTEQILIIVLGSILLALAIAVTVLAMMQSGKDKKLSGAIAGGSDSFYGKTKNKDNTKVLSVATSIVAIVFVVLVFAMYIIL